MGAGGEALLLHGALEQALGVGGELAVGADLLGVHLRVGEDGFGEFRGLPIPGLRCETRGTRFCGEGEAGVLALAGGEDAGADLG